MCPKLVPPANGNVYISGVRSEARVIYSCNTGYQLLGNKVRTCLVSGVWSGSVPNCSEVICPLPSHPKNGHVSLDNAIKPTEANFTCNSSYTLKGSSHQICFLERGVWSGETVRCKQVWCLNPPPPRNGYVSPNTLFSTEVYISCFIGYQLLGSSVLTCVDNNGPRWSSNLPTCVKIRSYCPRLTDPYGGSVTAFSRTIYSTATYTCDVGRVLIGEQTRTCLLSGNWSGPVPICAGNIP